MYSLNSTQNPQTSQDVTIEAWDSDLLSSPTQRIKTRHKEHWINLRSTDVLSPSASPTVEDPQEEDPVDPQEEDLADLQEEEEIADPQEEEETADLQEEDLQEEDPRPETIPTRNQMLAANFPKQTFMFPTSHSHSMRRSLENTLRITRLTN